MHFLDTTLSNPKTPKRGFCDSLKKTIAEIECLALMFASSNTGPFITSNTLISFRTVVDFSNLRVSLLHDSGKID